MDRPKTVSNFDVIPLAYAHADLAELGDFWSRVNAHTRALVRDRRDLVKQRNKRARRHAKS